MRRFSFPFSFCFSREITLSVKAVLCHGIFWHCFKAEVVTAEVSAYMCINFAYVSNVLLYSAVNAKLAV